MKIQDFITKLLDNISKLEKEITDQKDPKTKIFLKGSLFSLVSIVLELKREYEADLGDYDKVLNADYLTILWETAV